MSLVAYDYGSSDEESENGDEEIDTVKAEIPATRLNNTSASTALKSETKLSESKDGVETRDSISGHISDDDEDDFHGNEVAIEELKQMDMFSSISLLLPKPKKTTVANSNESENSAEDEISLTFSKLPMPKSVQTEVLETKSIIEEEDDEFLRKKAEPAKIAAEKPPAVAAPQKGPVKITIPSLKEFKDVYEDLENKAKSNLERDAQAKQGKSCGLLSILPKAKSEQTFFKASANRENANKTQPMDLEEPISNKVNSEANTPSRLSLPKSSLVPDTVRHRRPAYNTEGVDGSKAIHPKKPIKPLEKPDKGSPLPPKDQTENGDKNDQSDDEETEDFFSLNKETKLPEVTANEISSLVAKKAAKMADVTNRFLAAEAEKEAMQAAELAAQEEAQREARKRYLEQQLNDEAMQALVGSTAKRRKKQGEEIQIMEISSDQILPDKAEWMRSALASSTEYQPTGVLVDEEPASGTRRRHQITYLAHKAKANEAELQAMWAANRQTRRATQSKYGF